MSDLDTLKVKVYKGLEAAKENENNLEAAKKMIVDQTEGGLNKLKNQIEASKLVAFNAKNTDEYKGEIIDAKSSFDSWKSTIEALQYNMNFTDVSYKSLPLNLDNRPEGSKLLSRGLRLVEDKDNLMQRLDKFLADPNITKLSDTKVYKSEYLQAKKLFDQLKLDADRLKNRKSILGGEIQAYIEEINATGNA